MLKRSLGTILTIFFVVAGFSPAEASHYSAGEVFYEWIGDEPGKGKFDYRVYATIYRNIGGVSIGTGNLQACAYRSSIGASSSISMSLTYQTPQRSLDPDYRRTTADPYGWLDTGPHPMDSDGWDIPTLDVCAQSSKDISEYRYVGEVTLTGAHADWKFAIDPPCCRDQNDNLAGSGNLYIEVDLNNKIGPNSSPRIITPAARAFCVLQANQKSFDWAQTAAEEDGDSLRYGFDPGGSESGSCANGSPIPYTGSLSASNPFPSNPKVSIDQSLGVFTMSPTQAGDYVVKIQVREFRFDTTSLQWLFIGSTVRELQIPISATCRTQAQDGPEIDVSAPDVSIKKYTEAERDSIKAQYRAAVVWGADSTNPPNRIIDMPFYSGYDCYDTSLVVDFDVPIKCETAVPTDFRLIGPDGIARPIVDVETNCQVDLVTSTLDLKLFRPLDKNGIYLLQIRTGNDGNTLENECGFELTPFYSALVEVDDCPIPEYSLENVSVLKDQHVEVQWEVNDSTSNYYSDPNAEAFFNHWEIQRRDHELQDQFRAVWKLDSFQARSVVDSFDQDYFVDFSIFDYRVIMVTNGKGLGGTRTINTIRLKDSLMDDVSQLRLYWNKYNGWENDDSTLYSVYDAKLDTTNPGAAPNWQLVSDVGTDTNYVYQKPEQDSLNQGVYVVKVETVEPKEQNYVSSSNWRYYKLTWDPVPPPPEIPEPGEIVIPNVFTPNGDGRNDRFYVSFLPDNEANAYEEISVKIFSRWGRLVFEDPNFEDRNTFEKGWDGSDINSGNVLPNGVYYYLIELKDPGVEETKNLQGTITISSSPNTSK